MRLAHPVHWPVSLLVLLFFSGCDSGKPTTPNDVEADPPAGQASDLELQSAETAIEFSDAEAFFEFNTTDNDLGLQIFLDAEGWKRLRVLDPNSQEILHFLAEGNLAKLGITELRFESAEPSPAEVLAKFPAGEYRFRGRTVDGQLLQSEATLSHDFLPAPTITPSNGQLVDEGNTVVRWNAPGAEQVEIIIEQEDLGHVFDVTLSGSTTRLDVPPQFLRRGKEYKIEILAIGENGNRTIVESTFRTRE